MTGGSPEFSRLAIVGLGLLGGSVALAAKRAGIVGEVAAASRSQAPLRRALEEGVVDVIGDIPEVVTGADLVVLGTSVSIMPEIAKRAAPHLSPGAIVTDVGSVKGALALAIPRVLPPGVEYVGAHPMAGSHLRGVENARADLFDGACCVLTPVAETDPGASRRVRGFWEALGARVVERDPGSHDTEVAWVSHLPHVLAFAFGEALSKAPATAGELAGGGFQDFTRIARSDAELWGDILSANHRALAGPLQVLGEALKKLAMAIEQADTRAQEKIFESARENLAAVAAQCSAGDPTDD